MWSITLKIQNSFDDGSETGSIFLDISKAVDKVWYEGIICPQWSNFVWPCLDYGDAQYGQSFKNAFHEKLESI